MAPASDVRRRRWKITVHQSCGSDSDTDDYTQVIAYINEEFLRIQEEEKINLGGNSGKPTQEIAQENEGKNNYSLWVFILPIGYIITTRVDNRCLSTHPPKLRSTK